MAATARREIDTGEEDIAAIAKQISDHAEAIYQNWKARGLAPTEILSCRPTPGLKLTDSLRTKPRPEPKPELKQRPEFKREQRQEAGREQRPDVRREARREPRPDPEGDTIEVTLPPDLVPERNGTAGAGAGGRRADPAAMRLEVAREEERLLRALRTGGVVAECSAERPDVVPPVSLVDYAKSRYQDRLETGARKPSTGASGERRASLGSHVTEARTKFEARARRASSAGAAAAGEPAAAAGATPVRPFLSRGSVAERVLMFERCPSEATLELAKRKSPAATTWRGPHDVINRAQSYAASTPPKPSSAPAHTTLQRTVRGAASSGAPARVIPRFHFPKGRPPPAHQMDHAVHKVQSAFATFPNSQMMSRNSSELNDFYDASPILHADVNESHPFYYAQDVDGWLEKAEEKRLQQACLKTENKKIEKTINKKKRNVMHEKTSSFIFKNTLQKGLYRIQINIEAMDHSESEKNRSVNAQYVVTNVYDDVLDATENVINKIAKKINDS